MNKTKTKCKQLVSSLPNQSLRTIVKIYKYYICISPNNTQLCITCVAYLLIFCVRCPIMCIYVLNTVLLCPLQFPHKNDVRFVFTSSCLQEGLCHIYVFCVCLRIVVSNTHSGVFLLCSSSYLIPCVVSFSRLSIVDCPFGIL